MFPREWSVYEVGGYVRDQIMGIPSKDIDFAVEGPQSLGGMRNKLDSIGFDVFKVDEPTFTVRARFPKDVREYSGLAADFVLCRREGPYSDGRHPDWVKVGTISDDLARRDFTINAIAKDVTTQRTLDEWGGMLDIRTRTLRFVSDPRRRIIEDALRVVRGLRFIVTKQLTPERETWEHMVSEETAALLRDNIPVERVRDEIHRMFKYNTRGSMELLTALPDDTYTAIMRDGLWLEPTLKGQ